MTVCILKKYMLDMIYVCVYLCIYKDKYMQSFQR